MPKDEIKIMDEKIQAEDEIIRKKLEEVEAHKQKKKDLEQKAKERRKKLHDDTVMDIGLTLEKAIGRQLRPEDADTFKAFLDGYLFSGADSLANFFNRQAEGNDTETESEESPGE